jgi:hypothetical protein
MKNNIFYALVFLSIVFLYSCQTAEIETYNKTSVALNELEDQVLSSFSTPFKEVSELRPYEDFMRQTLIIAKSDELKNQIFQQALLQSSGDYDFDVNSLSSNLISKNIKAINADEITDFLRISDEISKQTTVTPVIFYPRAETIEKKGQSYKTASLSKNANQPVAVFKNVYDESYDAPGYILNEEKELVFSHMVSENEAWNNDVYVVGPAETFSNQPIFEEDPDGGSGGGGGSGSGNTPDFRDNGHQEYGGIFQITDLNAVEHWTAGKLEMRIIVVSVAGTVIKDKNYPKRARSNYQNSRWADKNEFLFYWNTPVIGPFTIEKWIERDGGSSAEVSITIPSSSGLPSTTIKRPSENQDDDLGQSIVQFTDPLAQVYGISYMNFKRK